MADMNIAPMQRAVEIAVQANRAGHGDEAVNAQRTSVADQVQLSAEARRRLDEMNQGQTIAEAFLKHVLENGLKEAARSDTEGNLDEEEAKSRLKRTVDQVAMDLGWLIEALGIPPEEATKLKAALNARASVDYAQSRPPVPEIIVRAKVEDATPTVFVRELAFEAGPDGISNVSVKQVAVTHANPSLVAQLADPDAPKVIVVDERRDADRAFESTLQARLMANPHPELHGMLIVRENAETAGRIRLRIDALAPL